MTKVKICGITNLHDARLAMDLGSDQIGFNFYDQSTRNVSPETAREIIDALPISSGNIGVFVNKPIAGVLEIAKYAGLDGIQLHGDEDMSYVTELRKKTGKFVIKAFRVSSNFYIGDVLDWEMEFALFDTHSPQNYGGAGKAFDWEDFGSDINLWFPHNAYLAGGLNPENVCEGIRFIRPYAVDVASGVESSPGKKDAYKMKQFIEAVRNAG